MKRKNKEDTKVIIVGAGMSGLTSSTYLARAGYDVLLIERNEQPGGLLNSFKREGFLFDSGARAILNSGIIRPMLNQLEINLELIHSPVSVGIKDKIIDIKSKESLDHYQKLLEYFYPESKEDIAHIISVIREVMDYMEVLYGLDNPSFRDIKNDRHYVFKELLPWLPKFLKTIRKINKMTEPVEDFLEKLSSNRSLVDIIDQHFFKNTPMFFAMGYFYVYLDYIYPKGGTMQIPKGLFEKSLELGGKIRFGTEITEIIPESHQVVAHDGKSYSYDSLIWCADLKTLYQRLNLSNLKKKDIRNIRDFTEVLKTKRGGDSIYSLFLAVDLPLDYFKKIANPHVFYTPSKTGLGDLHRSDVEDIIVNFETKSRQDILQWLDNYCKRNTYEISIPALRDASLA
ncbi:MAG: FAD-dependent oxidoreductase, partial [Candidatus Lokiarchaeota archaeon]|nr:FAD-dependent oxidoreductase [Candidatus Lokiarchaeota archaeon]